MKFEDLTRNAFTRNETPVIDIIKDLLAGYRAELLSKDGALLVLFTKEKEETKEEKKDETQ